MLQTRIATVTSLTMLTGAYLTLVGIPPSFAKPASAESCPYLHQTNNKDAASTKATYDAPTRTLRIQVARSVPEMMWPIAESMTQDNVDKILERCPSIALVEVNFQSGQKLTRRRSK